jgi:DNA-binding transcriptional MerR regulator
MVLQNDELLSTAEAARILNVTPDRVRQMAVNGDLVPVQSTTLGRLFARSAAERLARQRQQREKRRR